MIVQRKWLDYDDQWLDGFRYRIPFYNVPFSIYDIADGGAVQTDIPLLITIGSSIGDGEKRRGNLDDIIFDELGDDSKKIAITTEDGVTQQYVCIAQWDESLKQAYIWFRADSIGRYLGPSNRRAPNKFYLYYDRLADDNTTYVGDPGDTPSDNVWQNFYVVFMLQETPTEGVRNFKDLVNEYDGRFFEGLGSDGSAAQADFNWVNQRFLKSIDFEASDQQYFNFDTGRNFLSGGDVEACTIFALVDIETRSANMRIVDYGDGNADRVFRMGVNSSSHFFVEFRNNDVSVASATDTVDQISDGQQFLTGMYNGGNSLGDCTLWQSGGTVVKESTPSGAQIGNPPGAISNNPRIGANTNGGNYWDGDIAFLAIAQFGVDRTWVALWNRALQNALWIFQMPEERPDIRPKYRLPIYIKPDNIDSDLYLANIKIFVTATAGDDDQDITELFDELNYPNAPLKIRITDDDGVTIKPCEIVYWDEVAKIGVITTKIDFIDSSDGAHMFLYFDRDMPECGETFWHSNNPPSPVAEGETRMIYRVSKQKPNTPEAVEISAFNSGWDGFDGTQELINLDTDNIDVDPSYGPYLEIRYTGGDNEYVSYPDRTAYDRSSTQTFSILAMIRLPIELTAQTRIWAKREKAGTNIGIELHADATSDRFRFLIDTGAVACRVDTLTADVDDGNWTLVTGTYDGSDTNTGFKIYLNDADDSNVTLDNFPLAASMANSVGVQIGAREGAQNNPTNIDILEVRFTTRTLSADQVKMEYYNLFDELLRFDAVEELVDFQALAPGVLELTAIPAFHVGFPTVFVQHSAVNLKFVPGTHVAKSEAAIALIGDGEATKPKILTGVGASPGIDE